MHQTRQIATTKLPIPRKGTTYLVRASSHLRDSVPVAVAVRDMLNLANTAKEVKEMIKQKSLKINGRPVKDYRESIRLFNILEAGASYKLTILRTGKFSFEKSSEKDSRLCKVVGKRLISKTMYQLNLHDGSNVLSKDKIKVGDSVILDFGGKIKKHISLEKGAEVFMISGKYQGLNGKVQEAKDGKYTIKFKEGSAELPHQHMIAI